MFAIHSPFFDIHTKYAREKGSIIRRGKDLFRYGIANMQPKSTHTMELNAKLDIHEENKEKKKHTRRNNGEEELNGMKRVHISFLPFSFHPT